ncbi:MAG: TatD family hydrolase [Pseudomonadota bacterium]|nr:TatD family hydrolase [Pseudomonadota bacterium]
MLVDSHCHLDKLDLTTHDGNLDRAVQAARDTGVQHLLNVCITLEKFQDVLSIAEQHPDISASVGVHPCYEDCQEPSVDELIELSKHPKIVAIGETGLDYFRTKKGTDMSWQQARFRRHIQAANAVDKPLIIHTREAREDTIRLLKEESAEQCKGVLHCFTETQQMAEQALELGFYISISGIVTFKNATQLQDVVRTLPLERLLVETDSPYLAPVPFRGKPNEPAYVSKVAEFIADLKGVSYEELITVTGQNFFRLFKDAAVGNHNLA